MDLSLRISEPPPHGHDAGVIVIPDPAKPVARLAHQEMPPERREDRVELLERDMGSQVHVKHGPRDVAEGPDPVRDEREEPSGARRRFVRRVHHRTTSAQPANAVRLPLSPTT